MLSQEINCVMCKSDLKCLLKVFSHDFPWILYLLLNDESLILHILDMSSLSGIHLVNTCI
jgi:hypothetical protein